MSTADDFDQEPKPWAARGRFVSLLIHDEDDDFFDSRLAAARAFEASGAAKSPSFPCDCWAQRESQCNCYQPVMCPDDICAACSADDHDSNAWLDKSGRTKGPA